ncbi:MAG: post-transcriptional regulator [Bacilli bacterium]|jgi:hypothetical protein|nr:hypothetical protein [Mollicutes bacterium]
MEFESLKELYLRIKPALTSKKEELRRRGFNYFKEEDLWNYLKETKWIKTENLSLAEMVRDIFNLDYNGLDKYVLNNLRNITPELNLNE